MIIKEDGYPQIFSPKYSYVKNLKISRVKKNINTKYNSSNSLSNFILEIQIFKINSKETNFIETINYKNKIMFKKDNVLTRS